MKVDWQKGSLEIQPDEAVALAKNAVNAIRRPDGTLFGLRDEQALLLAGGAACLALFFWQEHKTKPSKPSGGHRSR
jgi:hypothetical protein